MVLRSLFTYFLLGITLTSFTQEAEIKLLFMGDVMGHGPQIKAAYNSQTKTYDYASCFQYVKPIIESYDFAIANLEVTLGTKPYAGYPRFSSPPALASALQQAGIDVLATANNHSCDRGKKGVEKTLDILDSLHIKHLGTYRTGAEKLHNYPLILEKNGIKIGLLNYTYGTNGLAIYEPNVVNLLDKQIILKDIELIQRKKTDVLIAFVHWGLEYKDLAVSEQKKWYDFFKENGISIVIGSHPHVVEPMLWNKGKDTDELVVYSLGNFISNQRKIRTDGGAMFELSLQRGENGKIVISSAAYLLSWVYKKVSQGDVDYFVLPIDSFQYKPYFFDNKADYENMMRYYRYTQKLLQKENKNINENKYFSDKLKWIMQEFY
jgi:poly-gamma-glutamate synthesis protein (capsule biosynthesis protein)